MLARGILCWYSCILMTSSGTGMSQKKNKWILKEHCCAGKIFICSSVLEVICGCKCSQCVFAGVVYAISLNKVSPHFKGALKAMCWSACRPGAACTCVWPVRERSPCPLLPAGSGDMGWARVKACLSKPEGKSVRLMIQGNSATKQQDSLLQRGCS